MENLNQLIQGYLGMTPKDKGCENWTEMQSKMEEEINDFFEPEIELFKEKNFLESALNHFWNDAHFNLQRKDLGDIERENYEKQLQKSKEILQKLGCL
jgi:hypothetical protein